jgi:hypothetical protein
MDQEQFNKYYDEVSGKFFSKKSDKDDYFKAILWDFFQEEIREMQERIAKNIESTDKIFSDIFGDYLISDPEFENDPDIKDAGHFDESVYERILKSPKYTIKNAARDDYDRYVKQGQDNILFDKMEDGSHKPRFSIKIDKKYLTPEIRARVNALGNDYELLKKLADKNDIRNSREEVTSEQYTRLKSNLTKLIKAFQLNKVPKDEYKQITMFSERMDEILNVSKRRSSMAQRSNSIALSVNKFSRKLSMSYSEKDMQKLNEAYQKQKKDAGKKDQEKESGKKETSEIENQIKEQVDNLNKGVGFEGGEDVAKDLKEIQEKRMEFFEKVNGTIKKEDNIGSAEIKDIENDVKGILIARDDTLRMVVDKYTNVYSKYIFPMKTLLHAIGYKDKIDKEHPFPKNHPMAGLYNNYNLLIEEMDKVKNLVKDFQNTEEVSDPKKVNELFNCMAKIQGACFGIKDQCEKNKKVEKLFRDVTENIHEFTRAAFEYVAADVNISDNAKNTLERCKSVKAKTNYTELNKEQQIEDLILHGKPIPTKKTLSPHEKMMQERNKDKTLKGKDEMLPTDPKLKGKVMDKLGRSKSKGMGI